MKKCRVDVWFTDLIKACVMLSGSPGVLESRLECLHSRTEQAICIFSIMDVEGGQKDPLVIFGGNSCPCF